jgi:hypothetical protein
MLSPARNRKSHSQGATKMQAKKSRCTALFSVCAALSVFAAVGTTQTWSPAEPFPRWDHTAVLDAATNHMIVFGGNIRTSISKQFQDLNDVWRFNANNLTWAPVKPTGTPPAPRLRHTAVYDSGSNRMIVFGGGLGETSPCENDVWVLTNANGSGGTPAWIQLSPSGSAPAPRNLHGAAYDPNTNTMIIYGGNDCFQGIFGDVWVLSNANGLGGTPAWTQLSPSGGGPGAREIQGGVAYDSANNILLVFGGASTGSDHNDTWVLSNANGSGGTPTWTQLAPSGTLPPARGSNSTTYDAANNRITIFGGGGGTGLLGDVWVLTNANGLGGTPVWTQLDSFNHFAEARSDHSGVYNPSTNKLIVFGGGITADESLTTNDVWILSHANGL